MGNYIENKLLNQINALKLENEIEVVIFEQNLQISGKYVSVVDNVEISSNFIELIYNKLNSKNIFIIKNNKKISQKIIHFNL